MYLYLDRTADGLPEPHRFLLAAMRLWVEAARTGRCACAALAAAFAGRGIGPATEDFGIAMATLDRDACAGLSFGPRNARLVTDDEARLLALLDAGLAGASARVRTAAATLVKDDATEGLARAIEWLALHVSGGVFLERDR